MNEDWNEEGGHCPIADHRRWCPCTEQQVRGSDLGKPFGVMLARCPNGHQEVGGPNMLEGRYVSCARCGAHMQEVRTAILNPIP